MFGTEIERKYLLKKLPDFLKDTPYTLIKDYYYNKYTRVREQIIDDNKYTYKVNDDKQMTRFTVDIKGEGTLCRSETSIPTSMTFNFKHTLNKRRYKVQDAEAQLVWEINEFIDLDLITAEVELKDVNQEFDLPEFLKDTEEITYAERYYGYNLFKEATRKAITEDFKKTLAKDFIIKGKVTDLEDDKEYSLDVFPMMDVFPDSQSGQQVEAFGKVFDPKTHKIMYATAKCNGKVFSLSDCMQLKDYYLQPFNDKE